ncbi:AraC family transcriptional regulator [Bradyrhizobium macuxiense]|nr:AraC family transcriptional regulator [Bradyrhizobium macuxiense]
MEPEQVFGSSETHRIPELFGADVRASSEGYGWVSVYASLQRERPFDARFEAIANSLVVLHRSGPVEVTLRSGGAVLSRSIPKGSIFFLPAGHACEIELQGALDTLQIYLRSELFDSARKDQLTPTLVENDAILQHLATSIELALCEQMANSALFVDPIARALANRISAISACSKPWQVRVAGLAEHQLKRLRDFVDTNLESEIRLESMASACGLSTKSFIRIFKASTGKSPYQYVIAARIERAKRLIEEEQEGLAEVALRCGFSHQEHLTRVFRRLTGQTPGQYRRNVN